MDSPSQTFKLYTYFRSSTTHRVRIVMNLKKLSYEPIFINLLKGQQKSEEYAAINPNRAVPALDVNGTILVESMAIIEYLEEVYPEISLLPQSALEKAQIRGFCEIINSGIHPYHNLRLFDMIEQLAPGFDRIAFTHPVLEKGFTALERVILKSHGQYCFGDKLTLADVFLVPQVYGAIARFKFDMSNFPCLNQVYQNLKVIPEFILASPENQPDFV